MTDTERRRWFRFSLRTLFILITVLCCWLGWQASIVHQRKQTLHEMQQNGAFQFMLADAYAQVYPPNAPNLRLARIPVVRVWLGDEPVQIIYYTAHLQGYSEAELDRLTRTFPEAELVERLADPCHPGCFPAGTLVGTPAGGRRIETLKVGDVVTTFHSDGSAAAATIESIFTTSNQLWLVDTDSGTLLTTATQPLCVDLDKPRPAGELKPVDVILRYDDSQLRPAVVREVSPTDRTGQVFNIVLKSADVFIAGGFVARSKPPADVASRQAPLHHEPR